jgi:hypothetical protein
LYAYEKKQLLDVIHRLSLIPVSLNLVPIPVITRGVYLSNVRQQANQHKAICTTNKTTACGIRLLEVDYPQELKSEPPAAQYQQWHTVLSHG